MKRFVLLVLPIVIITASGYVLYNYFLDRGVKNSAVEYIEAVRVRDFKTIYRLNHRTQKRVNLIFRDKEGEKKDILQDIYDGFLRGFESAKATDTTTSLWSEKFFFIQGMKYKVIQVERVKELGTPSAPYRSRRLARVIIDVEYANPESAPLYKGRRIKEARLQIDMILSKDVVKGLITKPVMEGWLFRWFFIDDEDIVYWR